MTPETLQKAKELDYKIEGIKSVLDSFLKSKGYNPCLFLETKTAGNKINLGLYLSEEEHKEILQLIETKIQNHLETKKTEFSNL